MNTAALKNLSFKYWISKIWSFSLSGAGMLVLATVVANFINFAFNAYLGRKLNLGDFAIVTLMTTFAYLLNLFVTSLGSTITYIISYLEGVEIGEGNYFFKRTWFKVFIPSLISGLVWIVLVPTISAFLNVSSFLLIASFGPAILFYSLNAYNTGYLQGMFRFGTLAIIVTVETLSKLLLAILFTQTEHQSLVALAIPGSMLIAWIASTVYVYITYKKIPEAKIRNPEKRKFPFDFFTASFMRGLSVAMFLSVDLILAKHFLTSDDAGRYAMLSLVGKMIFFFGTLLNVFIISIVSRAEGEGKDPSNQFNLILLGTIFLTVGASLGLIFLGFFLVPLLLGEGARSIISFLPLYSIAMGLFVLSTTIVLYGLARKKYIFTFISLVASGLLLFGLSRDHASIKDFVDVIFKVNVIYFFTTLFTHFLLSPLGYVYTNIRDILIVFKPLPIPIQIKDGRKNILIFNWRDRENKYAGGAETYLHEVGERWVKAGHSVTLFCSNDGHQKPNSIANGMQVIRRGGFFGVYVCAAVYYFFKFRGQVDVILDSENGVPFFTPLYAKEPVYIILHHVHQDIFYKYLPKPLALFAATLEKNLMPLVYRNTEFITVSESSKQDIMNLKLSKKDIHVINPGVDLSRMKIGEKNSTPIIFSVGRLKTYKSIDVLIRAFHAISSKLPDARLVIAGDGDARPELQSLTEELKLENRVTFLGKISEDDKISWFQKAWVFVNPSMMEGWGITSIEANACGTPVVASDVPGLRDSVKNPHTGFLVPYGNHELFAQKIMLVCQDHEIRKKMNIEARQWAENFSWDRLSEKFDKIISN